MAEKKFIVRVNEYGEAIQTFYSSQTEIDNFKKNNPNCVILPVENEEDADAMWRFLRSNVLPLNSLVSTLNEIVAQSTGNKGLIETETFMKSYGEHLPIRND